MDEKRSKKISKIKGRISNIQAANEFLSIYGFALLLLVVAIALLYIFLGVPQTIPQNTCTFSGYVTCKTVILGANSVATTATFLFVNSQEYPIENPSVSLNITNLGSYTGKCNPSGLILPGGVFECVVNTPKGISVNQLASGKISIYTSTCSESTGNNCQGPVSQTFAGVFLAHVQPLTSVPQCKITLTIANATQFTTGKDLLTANVAFLNYPIAGAGINFTSNTPGVSLSPQYANTNSNGTTTSYASSKIQTNANIMAQFGNCTASISDGISFVQGISITFTANVATSGSSILTVDSKAYSSLPETIEVTKASSHTYSYGSTVAGASGTQYLLTSAGGCGEGGASNTIIATTNCVVSANYIAQYYLTLASSPGAGGTETPVSGWQDSGNSIVLGENAANGYTFTGWACTGNGCGSGYTGTDPTPTITITNSLTETASYLLNSYTITASATPPGYGTVTGGGTYTYGQSVSISETPAGTNTFTGWTCTGSALSSCPSGSTTTSFSFPATGAASVTGNFELAAVCNGAPVSYSAAGFYSVQVPLGCSHAKIYATGGGGGTGASDLYGYSGGAAGGYISGIASVTPGSTLYIWVGGGGGAGGVARFSCSAGGAGGYDGGGTGGVSPGPEASGGGGGCSVVSTSTSLSNAVVVAGGGGGGGGAAGVSVPPGGAGGAGYASGAPGSNGYACAGGGGSTGGPGNGGCSYFLNGGATGCGIAGVGTSGGAFYGGSGGAGTGGGAGCGYYGGGGGGGTNDGSAGGGGGGSSWANTNLVSSIGAVSAGGGAESGPGYVYISWSV